MLNFDISNLGHFQFGAFSIWDGFNVGRFRFETFSISTFSSFFPSIHPSIPFIPFIHSFIHSSGLCLNCFIYPFIPLISRPTCGAHSCKGRMQVTIAGAGDRWHVQMTGDIRQRPHAGYYLFIYLSASKAACRLLFT